jgi:uncharacterized protein (DUF849 family)
LKTATGTKKYAAGGRDVVAVEPHNVAPILLHGFDDTVWPFVERAVREGFSTRVGLEDGSGLPDGSVAPSNAELVRAAVQIAYGR